MLSHVTVVSHFLLEVFSVLEGRLVVVTLLLREHIIIADNHLI